MTEATLDFRACDTTWRIHARGAAAQDAAARSERTVRSLERTLNAFDPQSAVARLNTTGLIEDAHVAALVRRAADYSERTGGAFDITRGALEHAVKAFVRGEASLVVPAPARAHVLVKGDLVGTDAPVDLNGIAKGYIVDRALEALRADGHEGFVDGGGDIARPTGPVAIASPIRGARPIGVLDTRWNIATSGNANRRRGAVDHLYDPRSGRVGARHEQVTVVARRDCVEADVLATTLAVLPLDEGWALIEGWRHAEALWVHEGVITASEGFKDHVWKP